MINATNTHRTTVGEWIIIHANGRGRSTKTGLSDTHETCLGRWQAHRAIDWTDMNKYMYNYFDIVSFGHRRCRMREERRLQRK